MTSSPSAGSTNVRHSDLPGASGRSLRSPCKTSYQLPGPQWPQRPLAGFEDAPLPFGGWQRPFYSASSASSQRSNLTTAVSFVQRTTATHFVASERASAQWPSSYSKAWLGSEGSSQQHRTNVWRPECRHVDGLEECQNSDLRLQLSIKLVLGKID